MPDTLEQNLDRAAASPRHFSGQPVPLKQPALIEPRRELFRVELFLRAFAGMEMLLILTGGTVGLLGMSTIIAFIIGTLLAPFAAHAEDSDADRKHPMTFVKDFWNIPEYAELLQVTQTDFHKFVVEGQGTAQATMDDIATQHDKILKAAGYIK